MENKPNAQDTINSLENLISDIRIKAEAGLCQMSFGGCREFLKDIMEMTKDYDFFDRLNKNRQSTTSDDKK